MKQTLKTIPMLKYMVLFGRTMKIKPSIGKRLASFFDFLGDYRRYRRLEPNSRFALGTTDLFPRLFDKTASTDIDPVYYIQGCWCARKIFENKPSEHFDIGSQASMVGIISQFVPTTMVDIRPLSVSLPELSFIRGDITKLPFGNGEIQSLSSICVIEHIGLGRYGDPLDQFGTEKAAAELSRVLAAHGSLYVSMPIDSASKVYFNAHRAFTRDHALSLFKSLRLEEESYIYGKEVSGKYDPSRGFGTGLYHFKK